MSRTDPSAASGQAVYDIGRCTCGQLETFHKPGNGWRGACSASFCRCRRYTRGGTR